MDIRMVSWAVLDAAMEEMLLRATGRARKVIESMIATTPGMGGTGTGEPVVVAQVRENADGTVTVWAGPTGYGNKTVVRQNSDGTWPMLERSEGAIVEWQAHVDPKILPTRAQGALPVDQWNVGPFLPDDLA